MIGAEVAGALDHARALPTPQLLNRAQVYPSHDEPGGESVPVTVPRVPLELLRALAGRLLRPPGDGPGAPPQEGSGLRSRLVDRARANNGPPSNGAGWLGHLAIANPLGIRLLPSQVQGLFWLVVPL